MVIKMYKSELNKDSNYSCQTCDVYDECKLHIKNTGGSLYCTDFELKYGCEWFYSRTDWKDCD
jgi:hypothetical protein